ncbi:MAG: prepilin peptidase [Caulobacteraceae bacterium]
MYLIIAFASLVLTIASVFLIGKIENRVKKEGIDSRGSGKALYFIIFMLLLLVNFYGVYLKFDAAKLVLLNVLLLTAVLSAYEDLKYRIIEDEIHLFSLAAGLTAYLFIGYNLKSQTAGFAAGGGLLLLIAILTRGGMGGADIKLMAVYGAMLGFKLTILSLLLAFVGGAVISLLLILLRIRSRKDMIPFSPFLSLGAITAFLAGDKLIDLYIKMLLN